MNRYTEKINKIEFVVCDACTGNCRHCSEGEHIGKTNRLDPAKAAAVVTDVCRKYEVKTVMTFGGEPMLNPEAVYAIQKAASEMGVPRRQLITNGFFSRDREVITEVVKRLAQSGVNDVLLSADAFHQEYIPIDIVRIFAEAAVREKLPIRLQPAWLVSRDHDNPYNKKTRDILAELSELGISESDGNVIFPEGNALKYLSEYFDPNEKIINPYAESPEDIRTISVGADGEVLGGNINICGILDIIAGYDPFR